MKYYEAYNAIRTENPKQNYKEDYDAIVGKISEFLKKEPTKRDLVGTASGLSGKYKGGFIYKTFNS